MSAAFALRLWTPADSAELAELFRRSVREVASRDYRPEQIEAWSAGPDDWAERMHARTTFVAVEGTRLVGFMQYDPPDDIDMAYVHPERQRIGIASALLAAVEVTAREKGVQTLNVEASITSRPFFGRRGYAVVTPQIVRVRGQDFLNYRMRKHLSGSRTD